MGVALGRWPGWMLLALCHCTSTHSESMLAAGRGGTVQVESPAAAPAAGQGAESAGADAGSAGQGGARTGASSPGQSGMGMGADADLDEVDAGSGPAADGGRAGAPSEDSSCLDASTDLAGPGQFQFEAHSTQTLKLWVPKLPAGCKAPVVHFANGTGAACDAYQAVLERLASHGFLSVCAETPNTGDGVPGLRALETVLADYPDLAAHKLGSAGHEAGGQGAILTLQQAEAKWGEGAIYAGMAIAPASGNGAQPPGSSWRDAYEAVTSPILMMSGSADMLVAESWVGDGYAALNDSAEAYWYSGVAATHIPIPVEHIQQISVAWFRWKLLGDALACTYFKQLPSTDRWDERAEQNAKDCR